MHHTTPETLLLNLMGPLARKHLARSYRPDAEETRYDQGTDARYVCHNASKSESTNQNDSNFS